MKRGGWYYLTPAQCSAISLSIGNLYLEGDYPGERVARDAEKIVLGAPLNMTPAEFKALYGRVVEGMADAEARVGDHNALTVREWDAVHRAEDKLYDFAHPTTTWSLTMWNRRNRRRHGS